MAFPCASKLSVEGGAHNNVYGNQVFNIISDVRQQQKDESMEFDEYHSIMHGDVHKLRDIYYEGYPRRWNLVRWELVTKFEANRTISTAVICRDRSSRFTVVSYNGPDAKDLWKKDFRRSLRVRDGQGMHMQLFGINRSRIPLLIFYNELVPAGSVWDRLDILVKAHLGQLARDLGCKSSAELWIDCKEGTFLRGFAGPNCIWPDFEFPIETLSSVELLKKEVLWRYLTRLPLEKLVVQIIKLSGLVDNPKATQKQLHEHLPIYLFVLCPAFFSRRLLNVSPLHFWSDDENGRTSFPDETCEYLGLPTELNIQVFSPDQYSWPVETYNEIHRWQVSRGFDPTTTDFARYLGSPIYEVIYPGGSHCQELDEEDLSLDLLLYDRPHSEDLSLLKLDDPQERTSKLTGRLWSMLTAPLSYEAIEGSGIPASAV
ncbi:hypothetical protein L218DRAFT_1003548 [Marasmius fiardii PR-910]|nr:hypothetical protein L218DRAFT_1003548 [Marasmius fiardii PR-910]